MCRCVSLIFLVLLILALIPPVYSSTGSRKFKTFAGRYDFWNISNLRWTEKWCFRLNPSSSHKPVVTWIVERWFFKDHHCHSLYSTVRDFIILQAFCGNGKCCSEHNLFMRPQRTQASNEHLMPLRLSLIWALSLGNLKADWYTLWISLYLSVFSSATACLVWKAWPERAMLCWI